MIRILADLGHLVERILQGAFMMFKPELLLRSDIKKKLGRELAQVAGLQSRRRPAPYRDGNHQFPRVRLWFSRCKERSHDVRCAADVATFSLVVESVADRVLECYAAKELPRSCHGFPVFIVPHSDAFDEPITR